MNTGPISFPDWKQALVKTEPDLDRRATFQREIISFLRHCKIKHARVSVELIRQWLASREQSSDGPAHLALRWFYREASKANGKPGLPASAINTEREVRPILPTQVADLKSTFGGPLMPQSASARRPWSSRPMEPPPAAGDKGTEPWEQALIKKSRERGFLWRTEQTYREWAVRFARFLAPRTPLTANGKDVADFLSAMAVEARASASAQKQALNALVFLMREALQVELGEMDFSRGTARRRVPTILSHGECRSLFAQLRGTPRLMIELAYGSGLRLMELLRLRVHHLDLARLRLQVLGGKGDKDRVTVLPERLVPVLRDHLVQLRVQWEQDRQANAHGVWLPEGLAKKFPRAGEQWEWQWVFPAQGFSRDPVSGLTRRHHLSDMSFQRVVKSAAQKAGLTKRVTPHTLRHCFGTHMLEGGTDIRTLQELMGHADIRTTQIYLHVMQKPGLGMKSPLDLLGPDPSEPLGSGATTADSTP
ncbi:MAG TPA: integron integrase [Lacunisphaera sp.]|jgi:integron integrase